MEEERVAKVIESQKNLAYPFVNPSSVAELNLTRDSSH
jgi:hypothetical protein